MTTPPKKLFTAKTWLYIIPALIVGSCWPLFREYRQTHTLQTTSIIISIIVISVGLAITLLVAWWANHPEKPEKPH